MAENHRSKRQRGGPDNPNDISSKKVKQEVTSIQEDNNKSVSVQGPAEALVMVNIDLSRGNKDKAGLNEAVRAAVALKNSCGGIIKLNDKSKTISDPKEMMHQWQEGFTAKINQQNEDPTSDCRFKSDLIFVRKSPCIITEDSHIFVRTGTSKMKVSRHSDIERVLNKDPVSTCHCKYESSEVIEFQHDRKCRISESKQIEFKHLKDEKFSTSGINTIVKEYVAAFANTDGGTLYFGIHDNRKVSGQKCGTAEEERSFRTDVESMIKELIWLPFSRREPVIPNVNQFRIKLFPVEGAPVERKVVSVHVCNFAGTVFQKWPVCMIVNEDHELMKMDFEDWLLYFPKSKKDIKDGRYREKCYGKSVYLTLKETIDDVFRGPSHQLQVHPKHAEEWIKKDILKLFLGRIKATVSSGHAFVQRTWSPMLGKPFDKPRSVICDVLVFTPQYPMVLATLVDSLESWNELHQYTLKLATQIKRELSQEAGCLEEFCVIPVVLDKIAVKQLDFSTVLTLPVPVSYPPQYIAMDYQKYDKIMEALGLVVTRVNSTLTFHARQKHFKVLTRMQYDILDEFYGTAENVKITGPPGTGKTVLALERVRFLRTRDCCRYDEILFMCSNKPLEAEVRNIVMEHDGKPLCKVLNYFAFIESLNSPFFENEYSEIKHIVVDKVHNFKNEPEKRRSMCWWTNLQSICKEPESTFWVFFDVSQKITKEATVKIPRFTGRALSTVIRTTKQIYRFYKRYLSDERRVDFGHDMEGSKPRILIPSNQWRDASLMNILLCVLHKLIVDQGHPPESITVLFADDTERKSYSKSFLKLAHNFAARKGEEVTKPGVVIDTIRRYSGCENSILIGFCPTFNYKESFQDNDALMATLCSRARSELILVFRSEKDARSFRIKENEWEILNPPHKCMYDFSTDHSI